MIIMIIHIVWLIITTIISITHNTQLGGGTLVSSKERNKTVVLNINWSSTCCQPRVLLLNRFTCGFLCPRFRKNLHTYKNPSTIYIYIYIYIYVYKNPSRLAARHGFTMQPRAANDYSIV